VNVNVLQLAVAALPAEADALLPHDVVAAVVTFLLGRMIVGSATMSVETVAIALVAQMTGTAR
jgi:hypothetical protein